MCDDLPCAAKILHPTLFETNDPGARRIIEQFEQECNFLSGIRHPHIVQYLGLSRDPDTRLPVLLMELMDESLTQFLERSQEPLPYHTQVDLCHDVALALAYLHSNGIIHRDLSSNNVLLIAGSRAKVTDFGMSKVFDMSRTTITPKTMCPGTLAYMSPEAFDDPPVYTKKLDSFSFGVLDIQIVTQQFPDPGPRMKKVQDPRDPKRRLHEVVPEIERRKSHIDLIDSAHPLLPIAMGCLSYSEEDRLSAQELCHRLAALKEAPQYGDSVQQAQERSRPESTTINREDREWQQEKKQLCDAQIQLQLSKDQIQAKDAVIAAQREEIQQLKQALEQERHIVETMETRNQEVTQKLEANETITAQFQQNLLQTDKLNQELQEEIKLLQQELQQGSQERRRILQQTGKLKFTWKTCGFAPCKMKRGSATIHGSMAYFGPAGSSQVFSYNSDTEEWSALPDCPRTDFTLTVINGLVTAVGGSKIFVSSTLFSLMEDGGRRKWVEHFPHMPTKRRLAAVVCSAKALVVAGGQGEWSTPLTTVEVMNTDTLTWSAATNLPHPLSNATATICEESVCLVGNIVKSKMATFICPLSALFRSQTSEPVWYHITDQPAENSTIVTLNKRLLAIGGSTPQPLSFTNAIYLYNPVTNFWEFINCLPTARYNCLATVLPGNKLMVVGGEAGPGLIDITEIASVE